MVYLDLWISLLVFACVATITPSGATTLATASGVQFGFYRSIPMLAGIVFDMATLIGFVAVGLGSIIHSRPVLLFWLGMFGSIYLAWLAWVICRSPPPGDSPCNSGSPNCFLAGSLLLWMNPKACSMALASAGAYSELATNPLALAFTLSSVFAGFGALSLSFWCVCGIWLSRSIKKPWQCRIVSYALRVLLVASIVSMWM